jgi:hypothetical protein
LIGEKTYDDAAPLSRWTIERSFDKANVCEAARLAIQQQAGDAAIRMGHAVCVASDDRRLNWRVLSGFAATPPPYAVRRFSPGARE